MTMRRYERAAATLDGLMRERAVGTLQLSRQTGIDPGILRRILSGQQNAISTRNMVALAKFFGMSLHEWMDKLS